MSKLSAIRFFIVLCMTFLFVQSYSTKCLADEFYLTEGGFLAGSTPENLLKGMEFQEKNFIPGLSRLMIHNEVIRLKNDVKVRVLERSAERHMIRIEFLDSKASYWVKEEALKEIDEK